MNPNEEKEFDEKLFGENGWFKELGNGDEDWSDVKSFITSLLVAREKKFKERAIAAIEGHIETKLNYDFETNRIIAAQNNRLREVIDAIKAIENL